MPIDLAQVDWLYVIVLAVFVAVSAFLGGLLAFWAGHVELLGQLVHEADVA